MVGKQSSAELNGLETIDSGTAVRDRRQHRGVLLRLRRCPTTPINLLLPPPYNVHLSSILDRPL
uniref:Uncharacterized protein n=1 Tax=Solanum lycopersicum TaxID=4081 RepID=A0A494G9N7_SOLLC